MKKILFLVVTTMAFAITPTNEINAQQEAGEFVISAGAGYSLISRLISIGSDVKSVPPLYVNVDRGVTEAFSIGLAGSYSSFSYDDVDFFTGDNVKVKGTRSSIAARALFHFGDNSSLDQYAGLRAGMTFWGYSDTALLDEESLNVNGFSFRILYGLRAYLTDNLAVNLEVGLGSPYLFNGGIAYRL